MSHKKRRILKICLGVYIILSLISCCFYILQELALNNISFNYQFGGMIIFSIVIFLISSLLVIIGHIPIIIIYIAFRVGIKKANKGKLSKIDYKNENIYFRDILKGYSSAELSYLDSFNINDVNNIAATLLGLQLKGVIELDQQEDKIIIKEHKTKLNSSETYIINNIKNGKLNNFESLNYTDLVKKDALESGLLKQTHMKKKTLIRIIIINSIIFFISILLGLTLFFNTTSNNPMGNSWTIVGIVLIMIAVLIIVPFSSFLIITYLLKSITNSYKRTQLGEEINTKLEGLKNYIKEYSLLNEKRTRRYNFME